MNRSLIFTLLCIAAAAGFAGWYLVNPPPGGRDAHPPATTASPASQNSPDREDSPPKIEPAPFTEPAAEDAGAPDLGEATSAEATEQVQGPVLHRDHATRLIWLLHMSHAEIAALKPECVAQITEEYDEIMRPPFIAAKTLFEVRQEYHRREVEAGRYFEIPIINGRLATPLPEPDFSEQMVTNSSHYCDVRKTWFKRFVRINPGDDEKTEAARLAKEEADRFAAQRLQAIIDRWR